MAKEDFLYVFRHKDNENVFVIVSASASELAVLRAWEYDGSLIFIGSIQQFLKLQQEEAL